MAKSNPTPSGDHGSLVDDEGRDTSSTSFASHPTSSAAWGESRPVPQARRFELDDGPSAVDGSKNASRRRVSAMSLNTRGDAPFDSEDEIEAQMSKETASGARVDAAAEADRKEKKAKKRRDKNRITDLEAYDLEGEDCDDKTEMLRRRASRRASESQSTAMKKIFGDVDDLSDGEFSDHREDSELVPTQKNNGGLAPMAGYADLLGGPLITGAAVRRKRIAPLGAPLGSLLGAPLLGNALQPLEPLGSTNPNARSLVPSIQEDSRSSWIQGDSENPDRFPEPVPEPTLFPDHILEHAPEPEDFVWRDDEEPATTRSKEYAGGAGEDAYADDFEDEEQGVKASVADSTPQPAREPEPQPTPEPEPEPTPQPAREPEPQPVLYDDFDAGDVYDADLGIPSAQADVAGDADAAFERLPPGSSAHDDAGWADGDFDDGLEAAGEADVNYEDVGNVDDDDDVF